MNDPISAVLAIQGSTALAQSALPHAPVLREVRARRRPMLRLLFRSA